MNKLATLLLAVTGAVFFLGSWFAMDRRIARGERHAQYSTYRSDARGTRRLFLFYGDAGLEPVRLKSELLMFEERGLLFIIEPREQMFVGMTGREIFTWGIFIEEELDALVSWVSEGNSLVIASTRDTNLHDRLGLSVTSREMPPGEIHASRMSVSPITKTLKSINPKRSNGLDLEDPSWVELFGVMPEEGAKPAVQAAIRRLGNGTVIALADPHVLSNYGITEPGNLGLAVRLAGLAGDGQVYFDEFHHGVSDPRTIISYMRLTNLHFVLFQVLAIFAFLVWRGRSRLGKPRNIDRERERGSAEYVRAFSLIYRKARLHRSVIASAYELFREKVALKAGLPKDANPAEIFKSLNLGHDKEANRFKGISARARASYRAGDWDVLSFIRAIAQYEKEYLNAGKNARKASK